MSYKQVLPDPDTSNQIQGLNTNDKGKRRKILIQEKDKRKKVIQDYLNNFKRENGREASIDERKANSKIFEDYIDIVDELEKLSEQSNENIEIEKDLIYHMNSDNIANIKNDNKQTDFSSNHQNEKKNNNVNKKNKKNIIEDVTSHKVFNDNPPDEKFFKGGGYDDDHDDDDDDHDDDHDDDDHHHDHHEYYNKYFFKKDITDGKKKELANIVKFALLKTPEDKDVYVIGDYINNTETSILSNSRQNDVNHMEGLSADVAQLKVVELLCLSDGNFEVKNSKAKKSKAESYTLGNKQVGTKTNNEPSFIKTMSNFIGFESADNKSSKELEIQTKSSKVSEIQTKASNDNKNFKYYLISFEDNSIDYKDVVQGEIDLLLNCGVIGALVITLLFNSSLQTQEISYESIEFFTERGCDIIWYIYQILVVTGFFMSCLSVIHSVSTYKLLNFWMPCKDTKKEFTQEISIVFLVRMATMFLPLVIMAAIPFGASVFISPADGLLTLIVLIFSFCYFLYAILHNEARAAIILHKKLRRTLHLEVPERKEVEKKKWCCC